MAAHKFIDLDDLPLPSTPPTAVGQAITVVSLGPPLVLGWVAPSGGGGGGGGGTAAVTVSDNGTGVVTFTGSGVTDNGDGSFTVSGSNVVDNGNGTFTTTT